jgi:DNA polymerase-3 subunit alpha/error-prone DNA polymerase
MAIKGLSVSVATTVMKERERGGEFSSLENFSRRVKLGRDDIIALCPAGVFDSIADGLPRPVQARRLLEVRSEKLEVRNGELFTADVLSAYSDKPMTVISPKDIQIKTNDDDLWNEYRALGFLRNAHPLILWKNEVIAIKNRIKAIHIENYIGQNVKMVGWSVTQKDVWTKDGLSMCFLSLEDETEIYETVVFPNVYERYSKLLFDQKPLLVYGRVVNDHGAVCVEISKLIEISKRGELQAKMYV